MEQFIAVIGVLFDEVVYEGDRCSIVRASRPKPFLYLCAYIS